MGPSLGRVEEGGICHNIMVLPECGDCHKCKEGLKCVEDVDSLPWSGKGVCMKGIICARNC